MEDDPRGSHSKTSPNALRIAMASRPRNIAASYVATCFLRGLFHALVAFGDRLFDVGFLLRRLGSDGKEISTD